VDRDDDERGEDDEREAQEVVVGVACCDPLACTAPMPSMLTSVAFEVSQVSVVDWPLSIVLGLAVSDAVGAAGGGGAGGGGGGVFL